MKLTWILIGSLVAATASAQMDPNMNMSTPAASSSSKFIQEMQTGMAKMDRDMSAAPMTGDPDHDFAAMMLPHHQGAIDMAKTELTYGKDPTMRKLAKEIIAGQEKEIDLMNHYLSKTSSKANP